MTPVSAEDTTAQRMRQQYKMPSFVEANGTIRGGEHDGVDENGLGFPSREATTIVFF